MEILYTVDNSFEHLMNMHTSKSADMMKAQIISMQSNEIVGYLVIFRHRHDQK